MSFGEISLLILITDDTSKIQTTSLSKKSLGFFQTVSFAAFRVPVLVILGLRALNF